MDMHNHEKTSSPDKPEIDCDMLNYLARNDVSMLSRIFCDDDPVTGKREVAVYTDDGNGNGNLIFVVPLAELARIASEYKR